MRDRIPEIIEATGKQAVVGSLVGEEYASALRDKLLEEVEELRQTVTREEELEELADIVEVIRAMLAHGNVAWEELERGRVAKKKQRGGFEKGVLLKRVMGDGV